MKIFLSFFLISTLALSSRALAQVPNTISYQGLLTTTSGTPVPDGSYKLQFDLFTTATGGVTFWMEIDSGVSVQKGTFSIILGNVTTLPDSFHRPLFLQVTALAGPGISGVTTFSPRSPFSSAPSALSVKTPLTLVDSTGANVLSAQNSGGGRSLWAHSASFTGVKGESGGTYGVAGVGPLVGTGGGTVNSVYYWNPGGAGMSGYSPIGVGVLGVTDSGFAVFGSPNHPGAWAGYFAGKLGVGGAGGDTSVQLPDNSIAAHEILDEPGLASHGSLAFDLLPSIGTWAFIDSVSITTPSAGYITVEAGGNSAINHTTGQTSEVDIRIDSSVSLTNYLGFQAGYYPSSVPTGYFFQGFHNQWVVAQSAGTYKYYLAAGVASGTGACFIAYPWIRAIFYPVSRGPVSELTPTAALPESRASGTQPDVGSVSDKSQSAPLALKSATLREVDLRGLELAAERARADAERAQRELLEAKLRLEKSDHP